MAKKYGFRHRHANSPLRWCNCELHPLIHTLLEFTVALSIVGSVVEAAKKKVIAPYLLT
jgi:hypothetical protein